MISACLNGQTGPNKDYPGFGGQGAALSGYNYLTGWPDREPVGPYATITDSLAPRYVAAALAAGLHYRARTGRGVYLDVSQVEVGTWTLAPWLLTAQADGVIGSRDGNRSSRAVPHGVFPCVAEGGVDDRWVAIACWTDREWARLAAIIGVSDTTLDHLDVRRGRVDEIEEAVAAWTREQTRADVAERLQAEGIEAVPVEDFGDVYHDEQLAARGHFVALTHPYMGQGLYESNGFRLSDAASGYRRAGPTLGQDNETILRGVLGLDRQEIERLEAEGAVEEASTPP
jgi:benzylsuccinate CoA-transferase BbsF subunit